MDKKERQLYLATVPSSACESGNLKRYYGCLTCYPFISDKLNHPSFDVQDVINDYDYIHQSDLRNHPDYDAERTEALKLIQETFRLSAHILRAHPEQLISQLLGRLSYPSLLENSHIQYFLEQAKAKIVPPALIPYLGSLQPPGTALIRTLVGHLSPITSLAITPDSTKIISVGGDTIKVWDLATGKELYTLTDHVNKVVDVAITPDGTKIISGSWDKTIKVWDFATGKELYTLADHVDRVVAVAITPDGTKIISVDAETIKVWNSATMKQLHHLSCYSKVERDCYDYDDHYVLLQSLAVSPDSKKIVLGYSGLDNTIRVFDLITGKKIYAFGTGSDEVRGIDTITVTPDGSKIISGSGMAIQVWSLRKKWGFVSYTVYIMGVLLKILWGWNKIWVLITGQKLHISSCHNKPIETIAITPDGTKIISGSQDKMIKIWDFATGKELISLSGHNGSIEKIAITPDGTKIISGSWDKTIKVWDLSKEYKISPVNGHLDSIETIAITPDGMKIISGSQDKTIKVWDLATAKELISLSGHNGSIETIAITPDGKKIISGSQDKTIKVWDLATGKELLAFSSCYNSVEKIAVTPDGNQIISGGWGYAIQVWDLATGQKLSTFSGHESFVNARKELLSLPRHNEPNNGNTCEMSLTPDGTKMISGSLDKTINVWDLATGKALLTFSSDYISVHKIAVTPDGNQIISGGWSPAIKVWDLSSGAELSTLYGHKELGFYGGNSGINSIAITPDSTSIISGGEDTTIKVWNLANRKIVQTLYGHTNSAKTVLPTPDNQYIISGSLDQTIKVWHLDTGECLYTFINDTPITCCAISPGSKKVIAGDEAGRLHFLELIV